MHRNRKRLKDVVDSFDVVCCVVDEKGMMTPTAEFRFRYFINIIIIIVCLPPTLPRTIIIVVVELSPSDGNQEFLARRIGRDDRSGHGHN